MYGAAAHAGHCYNSTENICSNLNVEEQAQRPGLNSIRINLLHNRKPVELMGGKQFSSCLKTHKFVSRSKRFQFEKWKHLLYICNWKNANFRGYFL